jgi:uncharacterized repeat protein (TIGR03803 family)
VSVVLRRSPIAYSMLIVALSSCAPFDTSPTTRNEQVTTGRVLSIRAHRFQDIYSFRGSLKDGAFPFRSLTGQSGVLYGVTPYGGKTQCSQGCGTVFALSASGKENLLYRFWDRGLGKGTFWPLSGLTVDGGKLYGTTTEGGAKAYGAVFVQSVSGGHKTLYSFQGDSDGWTPHGLTVADNGLLYGTTQYGGNDGCGYSSYPTCGTVFDVSTSGQHRVIYSFKGGSDGYLPIGDLLYYHGALYGTTNAGGTGTACKHGCGTVFRIGAAGGENVLYSFKNGSDGAYPIAGLVAMNGLLYGTTEAGGGSGCYGNGCGTVFRIDPSGYEKVLYAFKGGDDGAEPFYGSLVSKDDRVFGTTYQGGRYNRGTVFEVTSSGKETVLHSFEGGKDGQYPYGGLLLMDGTLFGVASSGGKFDKGTVFKFTP